MRRMAKYWTGLHTMGDEPSQPEPPFKGAGWLATLAPPREPRHPGDTLQEIILQCSSWPSAQRTLDLIRSCHRLLLGDPDVFGMDLVAYNEDEPDWMDEDRRRALSKQGCWTRDFPLACTVAAKASRQLKWVYAVTKYSFSLNLYSVHHIDLEPWRSPHLGVSPFPGDHVMFAYAIVSAYSVVEDLGLTLRCHAGRPSRIKGKLNPNVKADLEERLKKAGVGLSETFLWTARGKKRRIEGSRAIPDGAKAPWSAWIVRDREIPLVDAIAYAEWFRSCVASHGVKELTRVLSPYDVINVQHVARRLLLEALGFWRWHQKQEREGPQKKFSRTTIEIPYDVYE